MLYCNRKEKSVITEEVVQSVLKKHAMTQSHVKRAGLSYTNDVFEVESEGNKLFLKFFTDQWCDPEAGRRELRAAEFLASHDIPTPEATTFGYAGKISPRNYAFLKPVSGATIVNTLDTEISSTVIDDSLALLGKMSELHGQFGFFEHNPAIHRTYPTHFEFINDTVFYGLKKLRDFGYNTAEHAALFAKWKERDQNQDDYSFCHNDFTPKHVLVQDDRITGIIDFEWSVYSEAISDATLWLTSLAEYGASSHSLENVLNYCRRLPRSQKLPYYAARMLILGAAWPHKNIIQPQYSQTCLDKAKHILLHDDVDITILHWPEDSGVLKAERLWEM